MSEPAKANAETTYRRFRIASAASYGYTLLLFFFPFCFLIPKLSLISPFAWLVGFIGFALGALQGLKADPQETTILSSFFPTIYSIIIFVPSLLIVLTCSGSHGLCHGIAAWSDFVFLLVMTFCAIIILASAFLSKIRKHSMRWDYARRRSSVAIIAAALLVMMRVALFPSEVHQIVNVVLIFLIPFVLLRWMFSCLFCHEAELAAGDDISKNEVANSDSTEAPAQSCDNT